VGVIEGRALRIESEGPALEALLHLPDGEPPFPGVVICHPHPMYGGDMYNNVVGALIKATLGAGAAALRFNFRGVGESDGEQTGGKEEPNDVRAALSFMRSQPGIDPNRVSLAGYSFGAMMAVQTADRRDDLAALISVSGPTERGERVEIELRCPTLFVTGDRDRFVDAELLVEYGPQLGPDMTVEVVPAVDHFWVGSDDRLIDIVGGFLRQHLSGGA
jgi:hypothetical protein